MTERELDIATAKRRDSKKWGQTTTDWPEILSWMESPADHKECGNYVLGSLRDGLRSNATMITRSALSLDADSPGAGFLEGLEALGVLLVYHTTYNSAPDALRYRVIVALDRDVTPDEYVHVTQRVMQKVGMGHWDKGSSEPARYMFRPSAQELQWFTWAELGVVPLVADAWLDDFVDDLSEMPVPSARNKRDPFEIEGTIGAFNRVYEDINELIVRYDLPYVPTGDRWQLEGSRSIAGMSTVGPGLVYSHHTTDPAYGQTCSAFDLVRLHRFGGLDLECEEKTPVNRRPSHTAMLELASKDTKVVMDLVGSDFADDLQVDSWKLKLRLNPKSGQMRDVIDNWDLVRDNDPVFTAFYFNEFSMAVEIDADMPWRPISRGGPVFSSTDRAALCHYIEREYRLRPARSFVDEVVATTAQKRYVNPVRDYLESLSWDGEKRVEDCLPGVTPTPYTKMVARKSMVAAVARALDPGCKWDHTLVLAGDEGLGKSYWVDKMSRGHSASLGRIGDKDTLLVMQRSWIMLADEGYSLRKADTDMLKEFLTRTEDVFRLPYERESMAHKRHCVIWSSTNDDVFLRRQEGNRRFLIVNCEKRVDFNALTDDYIDQVWAEAVALYKAGELLFLNDDESQASAKVREDFTEEDALGGVISHYLETLVPEDWKQMTPLARLMWLQSNSNDGTEQIMETCSTQIWVEALGQDIGKARRTDLLEISAALKRLPGWKSTTGRVRVAHYGPQLVFKRVDQVVADLDEVL